MSIKKFEKEGKMFFEFNFKDIDPVNIIQKIDAKTGGYAISGCMDQLFFGEPYGSVGYLNIPRNYSQEPRN